MPILVFFCAAFVLNPFTLAQASEYPRYEAPATYWVPVTPDLIQFSVFPIERAEVKDLGAEIEVEYDLPQELTGTLNRITLKGSKVGSGPLTLSSRQGIMVCPNALKFHNCEIAYKNLKFDPVLRSTRLSAIASSAEELQKRERVAEMFQNGESPALILRPLIVGDGGEPHGFLTIY